MAELTYDTVKARWQRLKVGRNICWLQSYSMIQSISMSYTSDPFSKVTGCQFVCLCVYTKGFR